VHFEGCHICAAAGLRAFVGLERLAR